MSLVERQNLTLCMSSRRFTRKTNAFSKRLHQHTLAVVLHFMHYNFIRIHETLRITPAMPAGVTDTLHDLDWFLDLIDEAQPRPNRPKTYNKRRLDISGGRLANSRKERGKIGAIIQRQRPLVIITSSHHHIIPKEGNK